MHAVTNGLYESSQDGEQRKNRKILRAEHPQETSNLSHCYVNEQLRMTERVAVTNEITWKKYKSTRW